MMSGIKSHIVGGSVIGAAIVALVLTGVQLSTSMAQVGTDGTETMSGTINSLVHDGGEATDVIGGEWTLTHDGNVLTDFSADLEMASADGTGSHTHRIVLSDGATGTAAASEVTVVLTPTQQSVGGTVLVNATGLNETSEVVVKVDDLVAGTTESDEDGNLLYALGISENMTGSATVTVEDAQGSSGSAELTVGESEEATVSNQTGTAELTSEGNLTGTSNTTASQSNNTASTFGNTTAAPSADFDGTVNNTMSVQSGYQTGGLASGNQSELTTSEETSQPEELDNTTSINNFTSSQSNETAVATGSENVTSTEAEQANTTELAGNTTTFKAVADIYSDEELAWTSVDITVSITNGSVIAIEIDPEATDNHFGQEPLYGLVDTTP